MVTVFDASITGNLDIHFRGPVNAVYSVQGGEEVRVLGSIPELGNNQPDKATPLHTVDGIHLSLIHISSVKTCASVSLLFSKMNCLFSGSDSL